jgi:CDP-diacylglycerol--glycerol-3-phosphate 3-phosphatidyltransferase
VYYNYVALAVFLVASLTDYLDGYIARKYNQITTLGKFLDPLADKLLTLAAFLLLTEMGYIPAWITAIIVSRELIVTTLRTLAAEKGIVIAADTLAKVKTAVQMITVMYFLLDLSLCRCVDWGVITVMTMLTVTSMCIYIYKNINVFKDGNK